jgi:LysR family transcriptional regulator, carnitine catabolism transcriptional activator
VQARPLSNVSVRQMQAFVAIGRLGSFTRAAAVLHMTQPALSARIREVEEALSIRLFDRNTRSVRLTRAGEDLLPIVEQLVADFDAVLERARDVARGGTGRIALAALPSICSGPLPRVLATFRARHPRIAVTLRDALADRVLQLVRSREVDLAITSGGGADRELEFTPLTTDRIVAVLPARHPLARATRLEVAALIDHPLILMDRDSSVRHIVDATYAAFGRMPAPTFEVTYMSTAVALVRAGLGVTLLPSSAHEVASARDLATRTIDHPGLLRTIGVLRLKERSLSPAAQGLVLALQRGLSRATAAGGRGGSRAPRARRG